MAEGPRRGLFGSELASSHSDGPQRHWGAPRRVERRETRLAPRDIPRGDLRPQIPPFSCGVLAEVPPPMLVRAERRRARRVRGRARERRGGGRQTVALATAAVPGRRRRFRIGSLAKARDPAAASASAFALHSSGALGFGLLGPGCLPLPRSKRSNDDKTTGLNRQDTWASS